MGAGVRVESSWPDNGYATAALASHGRRPPRRLLPPPPPRKRRLPRRLGESFLVRFLVELPDDPVSALSALLEPFERAVRLGKRLVRGPALGGGWDSEAGRLAVAVHTFHWLRYEKRTHGPTFLMSTESFSTGRVEVHVRERWSGGHRHTATVHGLRRTPRPRRHRRRVDLAFADGSWLVLHLAPHHAARLRDALRHAGDPVGPDRSHRSQDEDMETRRT